MRTGRIALLLILLISIAFAAMAAAGPGEAAAKSQSGPDKIAASYNTFGFSLYSDLLKENKHKNVFISPTSIALALAIAWNGAQGETMNGIAKVLTIYGMPENEVNALNKLLINSLKKADPKVDIAIANSLWLRTGMSFSPQFIKKARESYSAEVKVGIDAALINEWVKKNTKGKITSIVDKVPPNAVLYIINAVYFKGAWSQRFDKKLTAQKPFTMAGGKKKNCPFMAQSGSYLYYRGDKFQALRLPYGDKKLAMYLFLPDRNSSLDEFHGKLSSTAWKSWMEKFEDAEGTVEIPRFRCEFMAELNKSLKALGMGASFDSFRAQFSRMSDTFLTISSVLHKSFVEVNEEGTVAAAVTSVEIRDTAMMEPPKKFTFKADRPFFFAIVDGSTKSILFMGSLAEPR
ncbi:MAG: serpin family protein [Candidatus Eremiobacteraeota bacterium]|nr:serpin family protein [Candidatus Eremiobacteraeota bacterium]